MNNDWLRIMKYCWKRSFNVYIEYNIEMIIINWIWIFFRNEFVLNEERNNVAELLKLKMIYYYDNVYEREFVFYIFQMNSSEYRKVINLIYIMIWILMLFMKIEEYSWMIL